MENNQPINLADITGVKLDLKALADTERVWSGVLDDIEEKQTQKGAKYWIFKSSEDENGVVMAFVTFSSTQFAVVNDALLNQRATKIVYQLPAKFGSFNIVSAELPDGTFSAKEAREAWKKGNKANNRASVMTSAVSFEIAKGKPTIEGVIATAEELLKWVEKEKE